jgi:hypothetical protein
MIAAGVLDLRGSAELAAYPDHQGLIQETPIRQVLQER